MKNLLIFLLAFVPVFVFAQYPTKQKLGNDSSLVYAPGAVSTTGGFINGIYPDTTAANLTRIRQYPFAQIATTNDVSIWLRNETATAWIKPQGGGGTITTINFYTDSSIIVCYADGSCDTIPITNNVFTIQKCGLIDGGIVTWDSLLVFTVSPATYKTCCDMVIRTSPLTNITLPAADSLLPKFVMIGLDSTGVIVVDGVPAVNPAQPQPTGCQIVLTYVYIPAGSTVPGEGECGTPTNLTIYDETGGTELTPGTVGLTASFTDTDNPHHLTKDGDLNSFLQSQAITFTKAVGTIDLTEYYALRFYIRLKTTFHPRLQIGIFFNNTVSGGGSAPVQLQDGFYNFSRTTTGSYQEIVIPMSVFLAFNPGAPSTQFVDRLTFLALGQSNADGFYIDYIQLLGGVCQNPEADSWVSLVGAGSLNPLFTTTVTNPVDDGNQEKTLCSAVTL